MLYGHQRMRYSAFFSLLVIFAAMPANAAENSGTKEHSSLRPSQQNISVGVSVEVDQTTQRAGIICDYRLTNHARFPIYAFYLGNGAGGLELPSLPKNWSLDKSSMHSAIITLPTRASWRFMEWSSVNWIPWDGKGKKAKEKKNAKKIVLSNK